MSKMDKILNFLLLLLCLRASNGHRALQCVQIGQGGDCGGHDSCFSKKEDVDNDIFSIGTTDHKIKDAYTYALNPKLFGKALTMDDTCEDGKDDKKKFIWVPGPENNIALPVDPCPNVKIRTYLVRQTGRIQHRELETKVEDKDTILRGWLHVQIELVDRSDKIKFIYVQMRDEHFNAIGEFVVDEDEQCPDSGSGLARPTKHQVFPCSAIAAREPKASQAIFMASKDMYRKKDILNKDPPIVATNGIERGVEFTWRLSEYYCNRHTRIRADAFIVTEKQTQGKDNWKYLDALKVPYKQATLRKAADYWINSNWFGAADIKERSPHLKLDCTALAVEAGGKITDEAMHKAGTDGWFLSSLKLQADNDFYWDNHGEHCDNGLQCACQGKSKKEKADPMPPSFAGRCKKQKVKEPNSKNLQSCLGKGAPEIEGLVMEKDHEKFMDYTVYKNGRIKIREAMCNQTAKDNCRDPETAADYEEIKKTITMQGAAAEEFSKNYSSRPRSDTKKLSLWHGRKLHGILCVFSSMFLLPVAIFIARYYKETWMSLQSGGVHLWYYVHVGFMIFTICLYAASYTAMSDNKNSWGVCKATSAEIHRYLGAANLTIFTILLLVGGYRPMNKGIRMGIMTAHSVFGFIHYILNTILIITSANIPASPSLYECDAKKYPTGFSTVSLLAIVWLVLDLVVFHPVLTVLQFLSDKKVGIKRPGWLCPIIPILPGTSHTDFVGTGLRKILLGVYIVLALGISLATIYLLADKHKEYATIHCESYNMSCTRPYGCTRFGKAFEKKIKATIGDNGGAV